MFYSEYPECCVDVKPISQEKIETDRTLISPCGKPALNVSHRPAYDQVRGVEVLSRPLALFLPRLLTLPLPAQHPGWVLLWIRALAEPSSFREPVLACRLEFPSKSKWASFQQTNCRASETQDA